MSVTFNAKTVYDPVLKRFKTQIEVANIETETEAIQVAEIMGGAFTCYVHDKGGVVSRSDRPTKPGLIIPGT